MSNESGSEELVAFVDNTTVASCDFDISVHQSKLEVISEETYVWMSIDFLHSTSVIISDIPDHFALCAVFKTSKTNKVFIKN